MEPTIEQQVQTRLAELPADVRDAIQSADLTRKMQGIGTNHQLHLDQLTALEQEVMMVMLGFADPNDLAADIASEVHVPEDVANAITKEVSEQIFLPIRESMKRFVAGHTAPVETVPQSEMRVGAPTPLVTPLPADIPGGPAPVFTAPAPDSITSTPDTKPQFPAADIMLNEKTVTPPAPPQPRNYTTDPYREPIEPA